jgi:hypothetical protein
MSEYAIGHALVSRGDDSQANLGDPVRNSSQPRRESPGGDFEMRVVPGPSQVCPSAPFVLYTLSPCDRVNPPLRVLQLPLILAISCAFTPHVKDVLIPPLPEATLPPTLRPDHSPNVTEKTGAPTRLTSPLPTRHHRRPLGVARARLRNGGDN